MNGVILIVCCLLATSVTGNEDEWEKFDFDLDMSFETEGLNDPVEALSGIATTTSNAATTKSDALLIPAAESELVHEKLPQLVQKSNARLDNKRKTPYSFEYAVEDSNSRLDYGHKESSDGEVVTGTYYVLLPDGRKEIVNYKADVNGYVANVSYAGEAKNDNAQSQQAASSSVSSGIPAQANLSNSSTLVSTSNRPASTRPPQTYSSIPSVATKGPFLPHLPAPAEPPKSGDKASLISTASIVSSTSSIVSATTPTITTTSPLASSTPSTIRSSTLSPTTSITTPSTLTTTRTILTTILSLASSSTLFPTTPTTSTISIDTTTSIPAYIATSTVSLSSSSTTSFLPKSTLNSSLTQVNVTDVASPSKSDQNTTVSSPQFSPANKAQITSTTASPPSTRFPETSHILSIVSQAPGIPSSENQSFFQALAGFVRSAGPTFIYCSNLLPSCSDSTRSPKSSYCSNCNSLQNICSKSESTGQTSPIINDTLQSFQALIPAAPVWPPILQKVVRSASSENPPNSTITVPTTTTPFPFTRVPKPSLTPKNVSLEVPEGLADIVRFADTHFNYCQNIQSFCPRLESTRPYWEGSPEMSSKEKEFFLSTIQTCSYCRSLWSICSDLESSKFLLDPSQLFTLHSLEEDVRNAIFTVSYCRNITQDCNELLKSKQSASTVSSIPSAAPQAFNRTSPDFFSTKSSSLVPVDKLTSGSPAPSQLPEPDAQSEGILGETKFINYCGRVTPVCSQLLTI